MPQHRLYVTIVDFAASQEKSTFARSKPTGKIVVAKTSPKDESGHYYRARRRAAKSTLRRAANAIFSGRSAKPTWNP